MVDMSDSEAVELLNEYSSVVKRIAHSACYSSASIDFADLCQIGDIAILKAVKMYDPTQGTTIKSYVAKMVRQAVFNEAAKFFGVFTVDHRVTSLAAKVNKLHLQDKTDQEIAIILTESGHRNFDVDHIKDLRITYNHRLHSELQPDDALEEGDVKESTIMSLLNDVIKNKVEKVILEQRLIGNATAGDVASQLSIHVGVLYTLESDLKYRIRQAIRGVIE